MRPTFYKMCLIVFLFSGKILANPSTDFDHSLSVQNGDIPLSEALDKLSEEYEIFFAYDADLIKNINVKADISIYNSLEQAITSLLAESQLKYDLLGDRYCVIYRDTKKGVRTKRKLANKFKQIQALEKKGAVSLQRSGSDRELLTPLGALGLGYSALAQLIEIEGVVTDEEGQPLIGATVLELGTSNGTVTDLDGHYKISVTGQSSRLQFSYTGYSSQEETVGPRQEINIQLSIGTNRLDEVVVTAFGIEREKKELSYATQEIEGDRLTSVGNPNIINSLQGKVAGLIVRQRDGAPGSQPRINIRGSRSFTGNNEPLYVVDGMPIASGSRAIDINPSDIKSINVLKGPTAAALYGLRASNGVIIIETYNGAGTNNGKPRISIENSYNFDQISMFPDLQSTYGQGTNFTFDPYSAFSWGPKISEMGTYTNQLGEQEVAAVYDNPGDLFRTGGTYNSNLSIANSFAGGNYQLGFGYTNQSGILPNSDMDRKNVKFAGGFDLSEKIKVSTSINYSDNKINSVRLPWWATFAVPPTYNLKGKPTHVPGNPYEQINFRGQHDNFYWALENNSDIDKTSRIFGNVSVDYKILDWLTFNYRIGLDQFTTSGEVIDELGSGSGRTSPPSGGAIINSSQNYQQVNSNVNISIKKDITESLQAELLLGNEFYDVRSKYLANTGRDIVIGGFHHISNTAVQTTSESLSRSRVAGFFGNLSLGYKNAIYLTATGRNDIVSNMPRQNRTFFYPSVGLSVVFTEFLNIPNHILSFGKIRASVAEVGQAGPAHSVETVFSASRAAGAFTWPYQNLSAFTLSNQINSADLSPENTKTTELGVDLQFLKNRIGLAYTYYDTKAEGQIYNVPIAGSTGFTSELRNAGEMSIKGHEISLDLTPVKTSTWNWNLLVNYTSFTNRVISLAEGIEQLNLGGFLVQSIAREGEEFPSLFGLGYARDPSSGEVVVDGRPTLANGSANPFYGMPLRSTESIVLGSAQPDFEMTFANTLRYKNLSLAIQVDWRQGGVLSSGYTRLGRLYGILSETEARDQDYIFKGVKGYYDDAGALVVEGNNDITIQRGFDFYRRNQDPIRESNIFDATYIRLREVRLEYDLPSSTLQNSFLQSASLFLNGRNLWLNAALPHFDPEMFNNTEGESYNSYPQTKSFGGGVNLIF
ncbi:MAG: SusC/RagA family TonB-linked outer membrane protein [Saprospiraceae bacterium]|nr:SusC/RagA family TonB-linked outer membrane protein [Saprospiraceae bacterium]